MIRPILFFDGLIVPHFSTPEKNKGRSAAPDGDISL
jgi:hypothetical protein